MTREFRCLRLAQISIACCLSILTLSGCGNRSQNRKAQERATEAFNLARGNPLALRAFLVNMPKGAELHYHLSGGVYAESWIRAGAEDHLCVNVGSDAFVKKQGANCSAPGVPSEKVVPAEKAFQDQHLYDALVDAFSMRAFVPMPGNSGHDHFFDSFDKFGAVSTSHEGEWLDEAATRAASQNEQYLELMVTPPFDHTIAISKQIGWDPNRSLSDFRDQLIARGLRDDVATVRDFLDRAEASRKQREHCGDPNPSPACNVEIRYLYQVLRAFPPEQVFAQTLLGLEAAAADPRIVGINYVQPEDNHVAMADYALHMQMVGFLHGVYAKTHISLHAGEISPGMVPPDGLKFHIRMAVETAHAERIGHGVDVMYEDRPFDLLREMAANHVMVEINLTSNDVILGITGYDHPFPMYRRYRVPVALSTDDEGVSRIDLTHEYERAVETYALNYSDLKQMVRTSIEHSFLPGDSLWQDHDRFRTSVSACTTDVLGSSKPSSVCASFLGSSEKAQQQWELERRFTEFEVGPFEAAPARYGESR